MTDDKLRTAMAQAGVFAATSRIYLAMSDDLRSKYVQRLDDCHTELLRCLADMVHR